ncbi:MAG: ATP-binding protein, partial [Thermofilaceae archaeon]
IKTIASEGRKFGVFLILVTQRPSRIDADALSQCNSQIILRITNPYDQRAVAEASERLGEELMRDLPGLNVGEAIIVGELTRVPVIVKVRRRLTREGGADIDLVSELRRARESLNLAPTRYGAGGLLSEV